MHDRRPPLSFRWNSLFVRLLVSFLLVILLLLSFNWLAFRFYNTNIHGEIVGNNMLGLAKTVDSYEKHLTLIEYNMLRLGASGTVSLLSNASADYDYTTVRQAVSSIRTMTDNPLLLLENVTLYTPDRPFFIEKNGSGRTDELFVRQYASERYASASVAAAPLYSSVEVGIRLYPAANFYSDVPINGRIDKGTLLPLAMKAGNYTAVAWLNAGQLFERFHVAPSGPYRFEIRDAEGRALFQAGDGSLPDRKPSAAETADLNEGHLRLDDHYLFYKQGPDSGLTYIQFVPLANISAQTARLNQILLTVFGTAVLLGLLLSIALSMRFNKPIRKLISGFQRPETAIQRSNIRELDWISDKISDIVRVERDMRSDLAHKTEMLKSYGYLSKIKKLHQESLNELIDTDKPFRAVLFDIGFTAAYHALPAVEQDRATGYIRELIALALDDSFDDSFGDATTLQVEYGQMLSLLGGAPATESVLAAIHELQHRLRQDQTLFLVTIALAPRSCRPEQFASMYDELCQMTLERRLIADTQLITSRSDPSSDLLIAPADDQELSIRLQAGESDRALELLAKCMRRLEEKRTSARRYMALAQEVVGKIEKSLLAHQLDIGPYMERHAPHTRILTSVDAVQLECLLAEMIKDSCMLVQEKKTRRDPLKDYVLDYLVTHYHEELSLESVADQLQMSRSYLSTYFRERTGMTFTDYLNELRMSKAKELLGSGENVRIVDVAAEVGYRNVNSFIRMFKKLCGVTPGEYRRLALQQTNSP